MRDGSDSTLSSLLYEAFSVESFVKFHVLLLTNQLNHASLSVWNVIRHLEGEEKSQLPSINWYFEGKTITCFK